MPVFLYNPYLEEEFMSPSKKPHTSSGKQVSAKKYAWLAAKILFVTVIVIGSTLGGVLLGMVAGFISTAPPVTADQLDIKVQTTFVFDAKGQQIAQIKGNENKNRVMVTDDQIPQYLKNAFIAIEDERFDQHPGVDWKRTIAATLNWFVPGGKSFGGSTITQQLIKNITGEDQNTPGRKIQEVWRATQLEQKYDKWQILLMYMNVIYMGEDCYGVQAASRAYYDKDVKDLSLAESALLAGITNSPGKYNPLTVKGRKNAIDRQHIILDKMLSLGMIKQQEYDQALQEELIFNEEYREESKEASKHSYFVDQVIQEVKKGLMEKGMSEGMALKTIYNYGLKIYTTQDTKIQQAMDSVFLDPENFTSSGGISAQAAMVIMDPKSGQVKALYGGAGEKNLNQGLNRATQIKRQPGSTFKPIAVYAPMLDNGLITAATPIDNVPVYLDSKNPKPYPTNFDSDGGYTGLTTIRKAITDSINVVAAQVWLKAPDLSLEYIKKLGIPRDDERYLSLALGGLNQGVNPLQMAAAYQAFDNNGMYYKPYMYTRVEDRNGNVLLENKPQGSVVYTNEATSYIMTSMMQDVVKYGTAKSYGPIKNKKGQEIATAGKTGTTSKTIDKWFVGFTPYYVAATWYGYDKQRTLTSKETGRALLLWNKVMRKVHEDLAPAEFTQPKGIVKKAVCIDSGLTPTEACYKDPRGNRVREEIFIEGTEPKDAQTCHVHVQARVCKSSKDIYGRNLLAGPNCPPSTIMEGVFIQRPQEYKPRNPSDPYPDDWKYELAGGEYCTVHGG